MVLKTQVRMIIYNYLESSKKCTASGSFIKELFRTEEDYRDIVDLTFYRL